MDDAVRVNAFLYTVSKDLLGRRNKNSVREIRAPQVELP